MTQPIGYRNSAKRLLDELANSPAAVTTFAKIVDPSRSSYSANLYQNTLDSLGKLITTASSKHIASLERDGDLLIVISKVASASKILAYLLDVDRDDEDGLHYGRHSHLDDKAPLSLSVNYPRVKAQVINARFQLSQLLYATVELYRSSIQLSMLDQ